MKMIITIGVAVLCSICLVAIFPFNKFRPEFQPVKAEREKAAINASSIISKNSPAKVIANYTATKLKINKNIPLALLSDGAYLGEFKFTRKGDIYNTSHAVERSQSAMHWFLIREMPWML